jgi:uncharacterized Ntn-hydrolase superfamily protein
MSKNDKRILDLQKKIDEKEKILEAAKKRFAPTTNCLLQMDGKSYNLHALSGEEVTLMLVRIHALVMAAKDMKLDPAEVKISGFTLNDWKADLEAKRASGNIAKETAALKAMKDKLHQLLSTDKKVELEIDDIEKSLS